MKTKYNTALTAVSMIEPERFADEFGALMDRIGPRFCRREPRERAGSLIMGLLGSVERKNSWTIAEHRGDRTPDGFQHVLSRAKWDADEVRDDVREYVVDAFGDLAAVLIVDETGDVKKGVRSVGVQRQYTGTAGRIENAQVAVYLTYYRCFAPTSVPLAALVSVAGRRWKVEESFQTAKGQAGLDEHQVRRWCSWHRWATLVMAAMAFLAVATAGERDRTPTPSGLIALTLNEFRHQLNALVIARERTVGQVWAWSIWRRKRQEAARICHYQRRSGNSRPELLL